MSVILWHLLGIGIAVVIIFAGDGGGDAKGRKPTKRKSHQDWWL